MKYIRTKYGLNQASIDKDFKGEEEKKLLKVLMPEVIEVADTIEELCDEFVVLGADDFRTTYPTAQYNLAHIRVITENLIADYKIYGAIWTDKGLIYVAKVNESGELELLWTKSKKIIIM